jgi:hypothetical protein
LTATQGQMSAIFERMGTMVTYHREDGGSPCPCRSEEGFRSPAWHHDNPSAPVCNEQGFLSPVVTEVRLKALVQPPRMRGMRQAQRVNDLLGEIRADDRIGIFPTHADSATLNFDDWSDAGEDWIVYDGKRYVVVEAQKLADVDGDPDHHWEIGMRLVKSERPTDAP